MQRYLKLVCHHFKQFMKRHLAKLMSLLVTISFCFVGCKKNQPTLNVILYDKPLSKIQSYIQGTWRLQYEKGGICSICVNNFANKNYFTQFGLNNKIKQTFDNNIITDTTIDWEKSWAYYINIDSTYNMNFYDKRGYPYNYVVDGIFNDTLKLHDNYSVDAVYYYFTKVN